MSPLITCPDQFIKLWLGVATVVPRGDPGVVLSFSITKSSTPISNPATPVRGTSDKIATLRTQAADVILPSVTNDKITKVMKYLDAFIQIGGALLEVHFEYGLHICT